MSATGAYFWEVSGKPVSVLLDYDVVDRLLEQVLRGFGVVPRRSVEVGGLLLGSVERREGGSIVHIEDFEPVGCQHAHGPSFVLSEEERARFEQSLEQWRPGAGRRTFAVGFYRSHVREGLAPDSADQEMLARYFPDPAAVLLLVKPFATRASVGGFFFREEEGLRRDASYLEFPFRRRDLQPAAERQADEAPLGAWAGVPPRHGFGEGRQGPGRGRLDRKSEESDAGREPEEERDSMSTATMPARGAFAPAPADAGQGTDKSSGRKLRGGWVWVPLSFIFLLLGVVLGFQVASTVGSKLPAPLRQDPYGMNLSVTQSGENLHLRWDRDAPVILNSLRGTLWITDGGNQKSVHLDAAQLQNGSVIYRRATNQVEFRMEVTPRDRVVVSETAGFRIDALPGAR